MDNRQIVTNLRIDEIEWLQIKAAAAELGMSVNSYINFLLRDRSVKRVLGMGSEEESLVWRLGVLAKMKGAGGGLSDEDKRIYK